MIVIYVLIATAALAVAQNDEPCAKIASSFSGEVLADTAYQCLQSVPIDFTGNEQLIAELKLVWQWQSEYGWLKNTPEDWELGKLDIDAELDKIQQNLMTYKSEYDVQLAIQNITTRTGNFHFNYSPDILQVFSWKRQIGIVSLSENGTDLPRLYVDNDIIAQGNVTKNKVSPITKINGQDPWEYLKTIAAWDQYIDIDGRLNNLFYKGDTEHIGGFQRPTQYAGNETILNFANGTTKIFTNSAFTGFTQNFTNITDGQSFFDTFCGGSTSQMPFDAVASNGLTPSLTPRGLDAKFSLPTSYHLRKRQNSGTEPTLVTQNADGSISGYFLNGEGYDNIAVLKISSFSPLGDDSGIKFQGVLKEFLAASIKHNKEKLIIDLRENGGGATNLLIDSFMQLFPEMEAFSAQRYRAQEQFTLIGDAVSEIHNNPSLSNAFARLDFGSVDNIYRFWAYWHFVTAKGENFADWTSFEGEEEFNGDSFTTTMRYNYSNSDRISIRPSGFLFINETSRPTPFNASNVLMFTDALCGSSCASFHEELKNIAGVHAVAVGGRPENRPIQTVTGTKGGEVIPLYSFPLFASTLFSTTADIGASALSKTSKLSDLANVSQLLLRAGDGSTRIQTQDQIRKGDTTATPLQYIYEAADCKIFYTLETYADPDAAWKQAWDAFQDDGKCVVGSTKHKSSISGGYKPFGPGKLKDSNLPKPDGTAFAPGSPKPTATGAPTATGVPQGAASSLRVESVAIVLTFSAVMALL